MQAPLSEQTDLEPEPEPKCRQLHPQTQLPLILFSLNFFTAQVCAIIFQQDDFLSTM